MLNSLLLILAGRIYGIASKVSASVDEYYSSINSSATDYDLKGQLQALINPHVVYSYDDAWIAFASIDQQLPTYPCNINNLTFIPDIYSSYCWDPEKLNTIGGECGNYQQEGEEKYFRSLLSIFSIMYR